MSGGVPRLFGAAGRPRHRQERRRRSTHKSQLHNSPKRDRLRGGGGGDGNTFGARAAIIARWCSVGRSGFVTEDPNFVPITRVTILFVRRDRRSPSRSVGRGRPFARNMSLNSVVGDGDKKSAHETWRSSCLPPTRRKPLPLSASDSCNRFFVCK